MFKIRRKICSVYPVFAGKAFRYFFLKSCAEYFSISQRQRSSSSSPHDLTAVLPIEHLNQAFLWKATYHGQLSPQQDVCINLSFPAERMEQEIPVFLCEKDNSISLLQGKHLRLNLSILWSTSIPIPDASCQHTVLTNTCEVISKGDYFGKEELQHCATMDSQLIWSELSKHDTKVLSCGVWSGRCLSLCPAAISSLCWIKCSTDVREGHKHVLGVGFGTAEFGYSILSPTPQPLSHLASVAIQSHVLNKQRVSKICITEAVTI